MKDRLEWLLKRFELRARAFHAGALSCASSYRPEEGVGYLHVLLEGAVRVADRGAPTRELSEPGVFVYFNPAHTRISPIGDEAKLVCATFEFGLGGGNPLDSALPTMQFTPMRDLPGVKHTLAALTFEVEEHHCGRQGVLNRICEIILILVLRDLMDQQRLDIGLLAGLADDKLQKALLCILEDPAEHWSLDTLASKAGMSRARFAAKFKNTVGTTPAAYLAQWRVGLCKSMLLEGKSLAFIANEVGYGSASALTRAFTQQCQCSPRQWRSARRAG